MKVQTPPLTEAEVAKYGPVVAGTCSKEIKTYRLVPKTAEEMKSTFECFFRFYFYFVVLLDRRRRRSSEGSTFVYSVGRRAFMVDIEH